MARPCPVCTGGPTWRKEIFSMNYKTPDHWPLPEKITWYTCDRCGMIFGDGDFNQAMLDEYYTKYYGYGVSNSDNQARLMEDAIMIMGQIEHWQIFIDFGGAGDDGLSIIVDMMHEAGRKKSYNIGPSDKLPDNCDIIYASHVLEHIYDLHKTMKQLTQALAPDGLLIVDVPDATGLLNRWKMPILDFNTKHLNHFTLRNLLDLGRRYGLEAVMIKTYELEYAPCYQVHFKRLDVAQQSSDHILEHEHRILLALGFITQPINIWGMSDIVWHILSLVDEDFQVLNYIDNDPAYRGQIYNGKPVLERPDNDAPIVIMAQGQRQRLIANIRAMGVENEIIEI